jgi:protein phosphatase 2C
MGAAVEQVTMLDRSTADQLMILATDGLWDVIDNTEAAQIVLTTLDASSAAAARAARAGGAAGAGGAAAEARAAARRAARALVRAALARGTRDNVSVLVIDLRGSVAPHATPGGAAAPGQDESSEEEWEEEGAEGGAPTERPAPAPTAAPGVAAGGVPAPPADAVSTAGGQVEGPGGLLG